MSKPYVIIHTHTSIEGKINSVKSPKFKTQTDQYKDLALTPCKQVLNIDGYMNGRTTVEDNFTLKELVLDESALVQEGDYIHQADAGMYFVAIDRQGTLGWTTNQVNYGDRPSHIISVLSEVASDGYKAFLREVGISYIIAGKEYLDNQLVLEKLQEKFGMNRIMIGGGATLNWSYLQGGLVDEVSLVVGPFANGDPDNPSLFNAKEPLSKIEAITFDLIEATPLEDSSVWLRYKPISQD